MKISFRRITTSGVFVPEVDGLRFVAIFSIVAYHLSGFILIKDTNLYVDTIDYSFFKRIISHAYLGIPLFFVISGFILGLPFAKHYLQGAKPVRLKNYFLRRLTRIEPPYIVSMTVLFFGAVYVAKIVSFKTAMASYFASIIYSHNFIFDVLPILNGSAWSLEVEVQFYILAPLLAGVYTIKSALSRRTIFVALIIIFLGFNIIYHMPFRSFINYAHFFFTGLFLAEISASKKLIVRKSKFDWAIGLFLFVLIWMFDARDFSSKLQFFIWSLVQLSAIFFLYYYVIFNKALKFFSMNWITNIGGMCYSIYLLHYPIISLFGNPLLTYSFSSQSFINIGIYTVILMFLVLLISASFFLLIERPCMDKDWYKKLYNWYLSRDKSN